MQLGRSARHGAGLDLGTVERAADLRGPAEGAGPLRGSAFSRQGSRSQGTASPGPRRSSRACRAPALRSRSSCTTICPPTSPCRPELRLSRAGAASDGHGLLRCRKCRGARASSQRRRPRRRADGGDRRRARRRSRAAGRPARAARFRALSDDRPVGDRARRSRLSRCRCRRRARCRSRSGAKTGAWWSRPPGARSPSTRRRRRAVSWGSWSKGAGSCASAACTSVAEIAALK